MGQTAARVHPCDAKYTGKMRRLIQPIEQMDNGLQTQARILRRFLAIECIETVQADLCVPAQLRMDRIGHSPTPENQKRRAINPGGLADEVFNIVRRRLSP